MLASIRKTIKAHELLRPGQHALLAVSGGADSTAMAVAMADLRKRLSVRLTIAHLNHGLRGRESAGDAEAVAALAKRLALPFVDGKSDVARLARREGVSIEMAARRARYAFFMKTARAVNSDVVLTAHTADDQVETMLLHLVRGTGMQGLAGIPYQSSVQGLVIARPLLDVTRKRVLTYLRRRRVAWREDSTNCELDFLRNRVRHEVLPLLEARLNPGARASLLRLAAILRRENEWLESVANDGLAKCLDGKALDGTALRQEPVALQRRIVRQWLALRGVETSTIGVDEIDRLAAMAGASHGTQRMDLAGGWQARRTYGRTELLRNAGLLPTTARVGLQIPGETLLADRGLRVLAAWAHGVVRQERGTIGAFPQEAWLDKAKVGRARVYVRAWQPGDRMRPMGMQGTQKLQDIFVDRKVPREERHRCPVLECRKEVVWLPGYTIARGWSIKMKDAASLHLRIERL